MRKRKILRIVSSVVALILCLAVVSPLGVLAAEGGMKGGAVSNSPSGGWGSPSSGDVKFEGAPSGVRIYLTTNKLVESNLSSDKKSLTFKSSNGTWALDGYKSLALYEISDNGTGSSSFMDEILNGTYKLKALFETSSGSIVTRDAYYFKRSYSGKAYNTDPTFKELTGKEDDSYHAWFLEAKSQSNYRANFTSLSAWANKMFGGKKPAVDIEVFLKKYIDQLKKQNNSITDDWLKEIGFPTTKSDFVSNKFCVVVEPVMLTNIWGTSSKTVYAWSAQDVEHYGVDTLKARLGKDFSFSPLRIDMRTSCFIDYTSNKYGHVTADYNEVTDVLSKDEDKLPSRYDEIVWYTKNGKERVKTTLYNPAGGFAFYYSNDVIAQDVPVQVANTVVVDVGAPKYINGSGSATGGDLGDSRTLGVAVNSTAYLDTSGDPIKSDTSASATKKGTAYSWYSGGVSTANQTYSGGKKAVGDFAFNGTAIQDWLDDDSQTKFIKSGHTLSTVKNKNILLSSAVYSCDVSSGAGSISTSPSSVASDLKTQIGLLNLGYSATQLKTTREATTGYTVICVTDYSRTAETLEGTAKAA